MFVIVKCASAEYESQWGEFKPSEGVFANHSIHDTYTGKSLGIKPFYLKKEDAEKDLILAHEANPTVGYAVCPVLPFWSDRVQDLFLSAFVSMYPTPPTMKVLVQIGGNQIIESVVSGFRVDFLHNAQPPESALADVSFKTNENYVNLPKNHDVFALSIDF